MAVLTPLLTNAPAELLYTIVLLQTVATCELFKHKGYAVELVEGLVLAAFSHPADGIAWGLACQAAMLQQVRA